MREALILVVPLVHRGEGPGGKGIRLTWSSVLSLCLGRAAVGILLRWGLSMLVSKRVGRSAMGEGVFPPGLWTYLVVTVLLGR